MRIFYEFASKKSIHSKSHSVDDYNRTPKFFLQSEKIYLCSYNFWGKNLTKRNHGKFSIRFLRNNVVIESWFQLLNQIPDLISDRLIRLSGIFWCFWQAGTGHMTGSDINICRTEFEISLRSKGISKQWGQKNYFLRRILQSKKYNYDVIIWWWRHRYDSWWPELKTDKLFGHFDTHNNRIDRLWLTMDLHGLTSWLSADRSFW